MFIKKTKDGRNNICGISISKIRKELKLSQHELAVKMQIAGIDIDKNAIVSVGDKVITSNVSDRYLYGLTIGYVAKVDYDSNNLTQTAHITPTVNFTDIKDVLVILDRKQEVNY